MRKIHHLLSIFAVVLFISSCSSVNFSIKEGNLSVKGQKINRPWSSNTFKKAFGDFRNKEGSRILTFDKEGIILYTIDDKENVSDFNVYYGSDPDEQHDFIPTGFYKSYVLVEDFKIYGNTSLSALKKGLPQYNWELSIIGTWRGEYKKLYIHAQYNENETKIFWLSIGKKGS